MSEGVRSYRELLIWQKGIDLVEAIYQLTGMFPESEMNGMVNQMRRSAVSLPANIAEGQARQLTGEFRQFLHVALGSAAELDTQIITAERIGYISNHESEKFEKQILELRKMIYGLNGNLPK